MRRISVVAAVMVTAGVVAAAPALADGPTRYWNSSSKPLNVYVNGHNRGSSFGDWAIRSTSSGTRSVAGGYLRDNYTSGNSGIYFRLTTYTNAGICVAPQYTSCTQSYYTHSSASSGLVWLFGTWSKKTFPSTGVSSGGSYARAGIRTCEQQQFNLDPCSGPAYTWGNPY